MVSGRSVLLRELLKSASSSTVLIAGTGYLVDMFDLFMFNIVRVTSLSDLGLVSQQVTQTGIQIINSQLAGLIVGSYVWGVLGDKYGRKRVLLGSILLYSLTSCLTSAVTETWHYAALRFLTGMGLAGELGAGIALISEEHADTKRGLGIGMFIIMGFVGVLLATACAQILPWRACYFFGGGLGLSLLVFRMRLRESTLFEQTRSRPGLKFGGLSQILTNRTLLRKYAAGILMLTPTVFIPQIVWSLSPEIAAAKHLPGVQPASILACGYTCVIASDFLAICLAEKLKSRRLCIAIFSILGCLVFALFLVYPYKTAFEYYALSSLLGLAFGTWVVGSTMVAEMFGTNLRATASTTIPNFCRGTVILMNTVMVAIKPYMGLTEAIAVVGTVISIISITSLLFLQDTYGRDLSFTDG